jgi:hypothetical protein
MRVIPRLLFATILVGLSTAAPAAGGVWPGFEASPYFDEQVREMRIEPGVRLIITAPGVSDIDPARPSRVVFFATPNGNTIEQTLGCRMADGLDWHYDIQHIAAQHRKLREVNTRENLVLVCLEAGGLSWPRWRAQHGDNAALIRGVVDKVLAVIPLDNPSVTLASHSGGGSFVFGFINGSDAIPDWISRIIFLDSNYGYDDEDHHGDKLITWLSADAERRLVVIAYDDREITYKGKKVVGPTGGTFRATHRMLDRFKHEGELVETKADDFDAYDALDGRARLMIHTNPGNAILHTRLVGEMNGYLHAMSLDTPEQDKWGAFGGPRAYMDWVQPPPEAFGAAPVSQEAGTDAEGSGASGVTIPPRPADALGGRAFMKSVAELSPSKREAAIRDELLRGNVPVFLRRFVTIHTLAMTGDDVEVTAAYDVAPDYLAIGSDEDFVRVPVTPMTAQAVADAFGCTLPTRKMVDDIYSQAEVKLAPLPLTEERTAVVTFLQHNGLIEWQRQDKPLGALVAGIKKDVVITNRLKEKPNRVAIYGWHRLNGQPIQPLYTGHVSTYVDYSHGVRLVRKAMRADGELTTVDAVLADPGLAALLSDEGTIAEPRY